MIDPNQIHSAYQYAELSRQQAIEEKAQQSRAEAAIKAAMQSVLETNAHSEHKGEALRSRQHLKKGLQVHTAFDTYTLKLQIGQGGNGKVFSASSEGEKQVAIKFVDRNCGPEKLKRFKNEVYFCETHSHKNIVPILDCGYAALDDIEYAFYVMPLYAQTLRDKINNGLTSDEAVSIFIGILEGLRYAHQHKTIHRDIKPENILFAEESMEPVICDFGIAHFAQEDLLTAIETKQASRMANFQYCAPEQKMKGGKVDFQTDLYAAALILNEMLTGEIPQGIDYPKIGEKDSEYAYLDFVVEELLRQHPEDRLFPEDHIFSEMKLRAEQQQRTIQVENIKKIQDQIIESELFEAHIIRKSYEDGCIKFTFDRELPPDWVQLVVHGSFSHSAIVGYEKKRLIAISSDALGIPIRWNESPETLRSLIEYVNDWVTTANGIYQCRQAEIVAEKVVAREEARRQEIQQLENDNPMNDILIQLQSI